jgi:hypothetical protein
MMSVIRIARSPVVVLGIALLFSACERKQQERRADAPAIPPPAVGTSGNPGPGAPPKVESVAERSAPERDPDVIKALESMGAYLRSLKAFQIRSVTSRDEVLNDGQKVEFDGVVDMIVDRPNRLRAEVTSDKQQRLYFDDGTSFTVWARRVNYYATIPAPSTLRELADMLSEKYSLELPVADLFYWGDRRSTDDIVGAIDLGPSQVEGVTCEHYAFRQEGLDWQVWLQQGDYPLPRKLVLTTTTDTAKPQFTAVLTWNLAPSYNDAAFRFVPPKDAKRITLAQARAGAQQ